MLAMQGIVAVARKVLFQGILCRQWHISLSECYLATCKDNHLAIGTLGRTATWVVQRNFLPQPCRPVQNSALLTPPQHSGNGDHCTIAKHGSIGQQKRQEVAQVVRADAVVDPGAVVVMAHHAAFADAAVLASCRPAEAARGAVSCQE